MPLEALSEIVDEPLSAQDVKAHLRIDIADEDTQITPWISAAREFAEAETWLGLVRRDWRLHLPAWPTDGTIFLPNPPLRSVTSVSHLKAGNWTTISAGDYIVDTIDRPGSVRPAAGKSWPSVDAHPLPIRVQFNAGFDPADVPSAILHAIRLIVGDFWVNREDSTPVAMRSIPRGARALLAVHRIKDCG